MGKGTHRTKGEARPFPSSWKVARLVDTLREHMGELAGRYSLKSLGVFGSYVRNEQGADSDLDVLVEFHDPPGLIAFIGIEGHLSELLGVKVDLVMRKALKPYIGKHILEEVVAI